MVFLSGAEMDIVIKMLLASALGALVGYERELSHRPAGLRTHMLVSMGAALFTAASFIFFAMDSRIAAGIVTGIGFIGAGNIIAMRGHVRGVTTAASLWAVAAIGMAVGLGYYAVSIIGALIIFGILQLKRFEHMNGKK